MDREGWGSLAHDAKQLSALGGRLPAGAAVDLCTGVFEALVHALRAVLRQEATGESVELAYVDRGYT